jgi:hypothetical protein
MLFCYKALCAVTFVAAAIFLSRSTKPSSELATPGHLLQMSSDNFKSCVPHAARLAAGAPCDVLAVLWLLLAMCTRKHRAVNTSQHLLLLLLLLPLLSPCVR